MASPTPRHGSTSFGAARERVLYEPEQLFRGWDRRQPAERAFDRTVERIHLVDRRRAASAQRRRRHAQRRFVQQHHAVHGGRRRELRQALAEKWDGKRWSIVPIDTTGARGVVHRPDAMFRSRQWSFDRLGRTWNGKNWSSVGASTANGPISSVSCVSTKSCLAAGTVAERWNGSRWSTIASPTPGRNRRVAVVRDREQLHHGRRERHCAGATAHLRAAVERHEVGEARQPESRRLLRGHPQRRFVRESDELVAVGEEEAARPRGHESRRNPDRAVEREAVVDRRQSEPHRSWQPDWGVVPDCDEVLRGRGGSVKTLVEHSCERERLVT